MSDIQIEADCQIHTLTDRLIDRDRQTTDRLTHALKDS